MNLRRSLRAVAVPVVAAAAVLGFQSAASAHDHSTVYVSQHGGGGPCHHPDAQTIQAGVDQAQPGGTVVVCPGSYPESVTITTRGLTLQGLRGATIDATGRGYGVGIGADRVTVDGLTIKNAGVGLDPTTCGGPDLPCAGINTSAVVNGVPTAPGNELVITSNVVTGNVSYGVNVLSTHDSLFKHNKANGNGIGFNVVDDLGIPVQSNKIIENEANDNTNGCGIALASHSGSGVVGNLIQGNEADRNGLAAGGAGVLLATPTPGAVIKNNVLAGNSARGNGHAGIEVHFHVGQNATDEQGHPAPTPNADASGNRIVGNDLGRNNLLGDFGTDQTVGIYIGSNSPLTIVVKDNTVHDDAIGIFQAGKDVRTVQPDANCFRHVGQPFVAIPTFA